ncbi:Zinc transporter 11 (ZRT/IRT-like protein 11) [Durusdinium trenchii]
MVSDVAMKLISAAMIFAVALIGSALSRITSNLAPKVVRVINAGAGGILLAVTLVHMLSDNSGELDTAGTSIFKFFTGTEDGSFPLGFALYGLGFLANVSVAVFWPDKSEEFEDQEHGFLSTWEDDSSFDSGSPGPDTMEVSHQQSCASGLSALFGLCLHSLVAGTAAGAAEGMGSFGPTVVAILMHKGFAAFSVGSLMMPSVTTRCWWLSMVTLALMAPVGIILGMQLMQDFSGPISAGLICFAAGCLLAIATYDMLMPALLLGKVTWRRRSFMVALLGFCIMSLLAIWS